MRKEIKRIMCECCGKHPAAYVRDSYIVGKPPVRMCCVCADTMITRIPKIKEVLNIREIQDEELEKESNGQNK